MKTKYLFATFFMLISFAIAAQEEGNKEMEPFEIKKEAINKSVKNLKDVFSTMFKTAQFVPHKKTGDCNVEDLADKISIDELFSTDKSLTEKVLSIKNAYLKYPQHLQDAPSREEAYSFDTRNYKSMEDGALSAFSNTINFADFVKVYTGGDVGDLNEYDIRTVRGQYDRLKANEDIEFYVETDSFMSLSCNHKATSYIKLKKLNYPNATWQIRTMVSADCDCSIADGITKIIKSGIVEYTAEATGLLTTTAFTFGQVENAKVRVRSLVCCPEIENEEESKTAINDSDDVKGSFQVGAFIGLPLGEEVDFYSLTYGVDASYVFNISDHFSAGVGVGYTHFTPKEFTVGSTSFKGEGIGYVPLYGVAQYELSENINIRGTLGYALSTDTDVDGGLNYAVGLGWKPVPGLTIRPEINIISLGEDRNFNSFRIHLSRSW